jgi:hypothetical protein
VAFALLGSHKKAKNLAADTITEENTAVDAWLQSTVQIQIASKPFPNRKILLTNVGFRCG